MNYAQFGQVAAIAVIAFFAGQVVKKMPIDEKWIPVICGAVGGILGIIGMSVIPDYPASNWIDALAVGISSGLSATGAHQIYKQLFANGEKKE